MATTSPNSKRASPATRQASLSRLQVWLPFEVKRELKAQAARHGVTLTQYILSALVLRVRADLYETYAEAGRPK